MSSRSRTYPAAKSTLRPLGGHLHEMATTRPVPALRNGWHTPRRGHGPMRGPQLHVFGQPGHGKTAPARKLHVGARRGRVEPLFVFDEPAALMPLNLALIAASEVEPLAWELRRLTSSIRTAGEW